ncbi:MAG: stearoyl-CoA 9-desaturase oxidoreductase [Mycobacterium sp.]|jgi:stearoyl-CoA 9-desaturase NADPH oxidoreductase|nr:stearoyl-CoA 9-desaturase oxidoreductase [Mycobacterium sp.]
MDRKIARVTADVVDTKPVTLAGVDTHPGLHALRTLAQRITTPLLPDDYLRLANPLWSARELRGRVLEVRRETVDSATLVIKPGWGFGFDYQAGQYMGIGLLVDGRWRWRSYSLTSSPRKDARTVTITVKAMPEGFLSAHLVGGVKPGTIVRLAAPQGNFVLPDPPPPAVLFVTAGSGITPVMSMLRTLVRRDQITDVIHLHSAPTAADTMFGAELEQLARDHAGYQLRLRSTRSEGRLDLALLDTEVPDWRARQTWACGPETMLKAVDRAWSAAGVGDNLHLEHFAVSRAAPAGAGGTVTFAKSGKSTAADAATSLMDAGEQLGVQMPFGCRMGICQSCVVGLVEGHVRDLRTGAEHEPGTRVQTCISAASGDCVLDV